MIQIKSRGKTAIKELKLKVNQDSPQDQTELIQILISILDFPDLKQAKKHKNAKTLGNYDLIQQRKKLERTLKNKTIQQIGVCNCCGMIVNNQQIPYCTDLKQIKIGIGTHLYFKNIVFNILTMTIMSLVFSLYSIITNQKACQGSTIIECGVNGISLSSKITSSSEYQTELKIASYLGIITILLWGFVQFYKNHFQKKLAIQVQEDTAQCSDFTLMIQNFPSIYLKKTNNQTLQQIQRIFKKYQKAMDSIFSYQITKVSIAHNLYMLNLDKIQQKKNLNSQLTKKQQKLKQWIIYRRKNINFPLNYEARQKIYDEYQNFYFQQYDKQFQYKIKQKQKNTIFVTLRSSSARQQIQKDCRPPTILNFFNLCHNSKFHIQNVTITKALPPQQIIWQNFGFPFSSKILRILFVYGLALLFLCISLGMTVGLNYLQIDQQQYYISALISLGITIINMALQILIMNLSEILNEKAKSFKQFNIAFKICLFQLLNVIGVPLLALYISKKQLYGNKGLSSDIFFIGLFNILPPLGRFIDPWNIYINFRNSQYQNPIQRLWNFDGQQSYNKIYEDNQFQLGYEYAYLIKTIIFTAFFVALQPIISIFAILGLTIMFFVNKYRILYRFTKPQFNNSTVNSLVNVLMHLAPIFFGLGLLIFTNWQDQYKIQSTLYLNWIIFALGVFFFFLPFRIFYKCFQQPRFPNWDYYQKKPFFQSQYDRTNPVTKQASISQHQDYLKQLQQKQKLPLISKLANGSLRASFRDLLRNSKIGKSQKNGSSKIYQIDNRPQYNMNLQTYQNLLRQ